MSKWYIVLTVGLILGYAGGAVVGPRQLRNDANEAEGAEPDDAGTELAASVSLEVEPAADDGETRKLLDAKIIEVNELSAALDSARQEIARCVAELDKLQAAKAETKADQKSWQERRKERQEQWKKDNPEQYAEMQKQRTEFQDRMEGAIADKSAYLVNLDTSDMTEEEKASHDELLGRIAEAWEIMNGMQEGKWPTREQMSGMHENYTAIKDLYAKERDYALRQVGKDLGYDKEQSAEFSTSMQDVFDKTSPTMPRGMFSGRGHSSRGGSTSTPKAEPAK